MLHCSSMSAAHLLEANQLSIWRDTKFVLDPAWQPSCYAERRSESAALRRAEQLPKQAEEARAARGLLHSSG